MKRRQFISLIGGAVATWPLAVQAQQPVLPVVGLLRSNTETPEYIAAFRRGLSESGYTDGNNVTIDIRVAEGKRDRLSEFAADLVRKQVAAIVANTNATPFVISATKSMLVLQFVTNPERAVCEMRRVVRPGGVVAATVWDNFGGQPATRMFWDTVAAIEPSAINWRSASLTRATTRPGELAGIFKKVGLIDVMETMLCIQMGFANFDDYWIPTAGQGTHAGYLETLPEATRQRMMDAVKAAYLSGNADGPRSFMNLAWAARGTVPAA